MIYLNNSTEIQAVWVPKTVTDATPSSSPFITEAELEQALSEYNPTDNFKTVNGESIIGTGDIEIDPGTDVQWNQIVTAGTKIAEITVESSTTEVFVPEVDLTDYYTSAQTNSAISSAIEDMATTGWVESQGYLTEHQSLSAYSTTDEVENMITGATSGFVTSGQVESQIEGSLVDYWTSAETESAISEAMAGQNYQITPGSLDDLSGNLETGMLGFENGGARNNNPYYIVYWSETATPGRNFITVDHEFQIKTQTEGNFGGINVNGEDFMVYDHLGATSSFTYQMYDQQREVVITKLFQNQTRVAFYIFVKDSESVEVEFGLQDIHVYNTPFIRLVDQWIPLPLGLGGGGGGSSDSNYVITDNLYSITPVDGMMAFQIPSDYNGYQAFGPVIWRDEYQEWRPADAYFDYIYDVYGIRNGIYIGEMTHADGRTEYVTIPLTQVAPVLTAGTKIATITYADDDYDIYAPETDLSDYYTSAETEAAISSATEDMATTGWVESQGYLTEHQSLSAYSTTDEVEAMITGATSGFVTTGQVESQIQGSLIPYWTSAQTNSAITSATSALTTSAQVASQISSALTDYYTSAQTNSAISEATSAFTTSGDFKTINNESIIGSGNITIQGGGSDVSWNQVVTAGTKIAQITIDSATTDVYAPAGGGGGGEEVVELTQAQYNALTAYTPNTTYVISDADAINFDDYPTSAQTAAAISAATSGKQDSITTTANSSNRNFPLWNANGQITGKTGNNVSSVGFSVNGSNQTGILRDNSSSNLTGIYAPTASGASGTILKSNGNSAPTWATPSSLNLVTSTTVTQIISLSQNDYDNLGTYDPNTLYLIND